MAGEGRVVIVGGGPGDPGLITVKGLEYIKKADVIIYDRLAPHDILKHAKREAELIYAGKEPGRHHMTQDEINRLLVEKAREGKLVVRLKGGDPYTFGRGEEECMYVLEHGVRCEVVPGVPSYVGGLAYAGIPLTHRGMASSFAVVTGQEDPKKGFQAVRLEDVARSVDVLVILMGARRAAEIAERLLRVLPPETPAAVVMEATTPRQRTIAGTLRDLLDAARSGLIEPPALIVVGSTVSLRDKLWRADAGSS